MLDDTLAVIDRSIGMNKRDDGLYNAYNILQLSKDEASFESLYPMLEGQVAALSAGAIGPEEAAVIVEALFDSDVYRPDQNSFMLYPDRKLPRFLEKNQVAENQVQAVALLEKMLTKGDRRIITQDANGVYRFNVDFANVGDLDAALDALMPEYGGDVEAAREPVKQLYEQVFNHSEFTGRSGGMFGFEGLGCIYWHMVSKLLLAVQENFFSALDRGCDAALLQRLGELYYRVRAGIGFNKTPEEYGAFPTDPYSHTPRHSGAKQPGMTGQVKEEVLSRFGELGVRVENGAVRFEPRLLRAREFVQEARQFRYVDVDGQWQEIDVPKGGLAFTWCQVPVVYQLSDDASTLLMLRGRNGDQETLTELALSPELSAQPLPRSGQIRQLTVKFGTNLLLET